MSGVVIFNPHSGRTETTQQQLEELFPDCTVIESKPDGMMALIEEHAATAPSFIGVSGGDGTIRGAAEVLAGTDVPLLAIPGGTLNHFARQVGIEDFDIAAKTAADGVDERVDLGEVNGNVFLNNASVGIYARTVRSREMHEKRMPKWLAQIRASWHQMRNGRHQRICVDGEWHQAWMIFVGNGRYQNGPGGLLPERESLQDHELDVRILRADQRLGRTRVVFAVLLGRIDKSPLVEQWTCREVTIEVKGRHTDVALDGEVERVESPLHFRVRTEALLVRIPRSADPARQH